MSRRGLIAAPKPGSPPLMERRADRELPDPNSGFRWSRSFSIFLAVIAAASAAIFNYQKLSSPVVSSTLYALRTSPRAREYLGDEVYFAFPIPWISGKMNQLRGQIDISFRVKGTRATGTMRFACVRRTRKGAFETLEWTLRTEDGDKIDLLEDGDPLGVVQMDMNGDFLADEAVLRALKEEDKREELVAKGFRQMPKT